MALLSPSMSSLVFLVISSVAWSHPTNYHHHHPWEAFQNLSGCRLGDHRAGLVHLKRYFHRFGYLPGSPSYFTDDFDHELESALVAYQQNFHLAATGTADASTLSFISKPRCGVADVGVINGTASRPARGRNLYSYFPGNPPPMWPPSKRQLTYAFTNAGLSSDVRAVFARSFARWSAVTTFSFSEADSGSPDITISFARGNHGDGDARAFDGMGGVLAHAFRPTIGLLHVDADEEWVVQGDVTTASSENAMDLESVIVHEIGHILGLRHSDVREAIMYPYISARTRKVELANDDIWGIQNLYGGN